MRTIRRAYLAPCLTLLLCSVAFGQNPQATPPPSLALNVGGEVERPLKLNATDWAKLPRRTVKAKDHDGKDATFEGVPLVEVLKLAGVPFGEQLRGKQVALFLLVEAADGYKAVFALPELDPAYTDRSIILADRRDNAPLSEKEGQLRVIVPDEKRQARWVRQVTALNIRRAQ